MLSGITIFYTNFNVIFQFLKCLPWCNQAESTLSCTKTLRPELFMRIKETDQKKTVNQKSVMFT